MKSVLLISFTIFSCLTAYSQPKSKKILFVQVSENNKKVVRLLNYRKEHPDSLSVLRELKKVIVSFRNASYITASIDSVHYSADSVIALFSPGEPYQWSKLRKGNVNDVILQKVNFKEKFYRNELFSFREYAKLSEAFLKYSENNGYPFATIQLDSIEFMEKGNISASLHYNSGPLIQYDSIKIIGKTRIKKKFLINYLRIFPGQTFSQEKVNNINKLVKELPYLRQTRPWFIVFNDNKAIIHLFLEDRRSNQIDGIVGFLPNQNAPSKLLITGEANLRLKNLFNSGKSFSGEWRKFNQASQLLNLSYFHPKLLSSNLDVKLDFNLLKQDTTFLNMFRKITLYQRTGRFGTVNFSGGLKTSRELISEKIVSKEQLPDYSNFDYYTYGLGYDWNDLDDLFFPHKGWQLSMQVSGGNKSIKKSSTMPDSLYNSISLNSVQLSVNMGIERHSPLGKKSVLVTRLEGGQLFNDPENIFFNDLYRLGGLKSLRGFAENYFYASSYAAGTIEYRFFTEETSYLMLFFDQGLVYNTLLENTSRDLPFGIGAGVSFSTGVGIFNFVYSLGNSETQKLNLNLSKIHFGIISRF